MSYFSRLAEQAGMAATETGYGRRRPRPPVSPTAFEVEEVREHRPPASPAQAPHHAEPAAPPLSAPRRPVTPVGTVSSASSAPASARRGAPAHGRAASPAATGGRQPPPGSALPPQAVQRPADNALWGRAAEAPVPPPTSPPRVSGIEEESAEQSAPRLAHAVTPPSDRPDTDLPGQRTLETVAALRAWAAAAPESVAQSTTVYSTASAPSAIHAAVATTGERDWPTSRAELSAGVTYAAAPQAENLSLSIGAIELTVEAPQQPSAPAPPPSPAGVSDSSGEGVSRQLRRHYVNWLGGP
ncbi:hypothetical protein [Mycolicibacterium iranicum]|uniref:Uncharacterized protein n=1 Tax=Mycolicibacterium iranicum TaxID=912594 RepID=A0A178LTL7_MYCIR|nr:hypothetical protein [Mycolicibacterium iranicum]OAN36776.1 hypothetical protein A4X20_06160 [Mycolicibacterium iranicum]